MTPPPLLELCDVCLRFNSKEVLHKINLKLESRERLVILGRSGSGKSTLLRLLTGILKPDSGQVLFEGEDLNRRSHKELNALRRNIGMVYQNSALLSSFTVAQNLALPLEELTETPGHEIASIVREKLALVGMSNTEALYPAELSGGMRKRAAIARALVLEPQLLLFDEPSAGLDPIVSSTIHELILDLGEGTQTTFVVVTHEMVTAFRIATRMALLREGRFHFQGSPEEFRKTEDPAVRHFLNGSTGEP